MAEVYRVAGIQAAIIAGQSPEMDAAAERVAARARALAAAHFKTGTYASGIGTEPIPGKRGVTDRIAYVDDAAAAAIEFGHVTRHGRDSIGPQRFVDGLHIMRRAAESI